MFIPLYRKRSTTSSVTPSFLSARQVRVLSIRRFSVPYTLTF